MPDLLRPLHHHDAENLTDEKLEVGETADGVESYSAPRTVRIGFAFRR